MAFLQGSRVHVELLTLPGPVRIEKRQLAHARCCCPPGIAGLVEDGWYGSHKEAWISWKAWLNLKLDIGLKYGMFILTWSLQVYGSCKPFNGWTSFCHPDRNKLDMFMGLAGTTEIATWDRMELVPKIQWKSTCSYRRQNFFFQLLVLRWEVCISEPSPKVARAMIVNRILEDILSTSATANLYNTNRPFETRRKWFGTTENLFNYMLWSTFENSKKQTRAYKNHIFFSISVILQFSNIQVFIVWRVKGVR